MDSWTRCPFIFSSEFWSSPRQKDGQKAIYHISTGGLKIISGQPHAKGPCGPVSLSYQKKDTHPPLFTIFFFFFFFFFFFCKGSRALSIQNILCWDCSRCILHMILDRNVVAQLQIISPLFIALFMVLGPCQNIIFSNITRHLEGVPYPWAELISKALNRKLFN